jgi:hypothetical protein
LKNFYNSEKSVNMEQQSFVKNINEDDRGVAYRILLALCDSSFADELEHYYQDVKEDLCLSEDQMGRIYNLPAICRLLAPEEPRPVLYKGRRTRGGRFSGEVLDMLQQQRSWRCSGGVCNLDIFREPVVEEKREDNVFPNPTTVECVASVEESEKTTTPQDDTWSVRTQKECMGSVEENEKTTVECVAVREPEGDDVSRSSSSEKNKHPAAKAMRKLLRASRIPLGGLLFDTEKYDKALIILGNTKPYKEYFNKLGGKWNIRLGGWVFSKNKLVNAMETAQSRKEQGTNDEKDENDEKNED